MTLRSLAWLVCSWSATPEIATNSLCMRSSALANPAGPLLRWPLRRAGLPNSLRLVKGEEEDDGVCLLSCVVRRGGEMMDVAMGRSLAMG